MTVSFKPHWRGKQESWDTVSPYLGTSLRKDMRVLGKVPPGATGLVRGWKLGSGRRARSNWYYFTGTNLTTGIRSHIFIIV